MKEILVTVIVLVYNNAKYLDNAVNSILIQDYKNVEVILTDDGSKEIDKEKFEDAGNKLKKKFPKILINYNNKNLGTVKHFNKVLKLAKGDIICPLACDDILYASNVITSIVNYSKENFDLIFTAKRMCIDRDTKKIINVLPLRKETKLLHKPIEEIINYMVINGGFISGACTYYRREVFEKFGYFDEQYILVEDYSYIIKLLLAGEKIGFLDIIAIQYRWGGVSTSKKMSPLVYNDMNSILKLLIYPNKDSFSRWARRVIELRYQKRFGDRGKVFLYMKYLDVIIYWGIKHLQKNLFKKL